MSFKTGEDAVQTWFNTKWNSLTSIAFPDIDFVKPETTWVRFNMSNNLGEQASMGSPTANLYRRIGIVTIQVFAKENTGGVDCRTKANTAAEIFITNDLAGYEFFNVNARAIGNDGNGWYQWNVTAEYRYHVIT